MKRFFYWLQLVACALLLFLPAANLLHGRWYHSLAWPWNGILEILTAFADLASPFVFIYLFVLAKKLS